MPQTFLRLLSPGSTYVVALGLEEVELQGDTVLGGGHQLPDTVFVWWVLLGPARAGDRAVELGEESATGSWGHKGVASPSRSPCSRAGHPIVSWGALRIRWEPRLGLSKIEGRRHGVGSGHLLRGRGKSKGLKEGWAVRNREGLPRGEQGKATQQDQAELEPMSTECCHQLLGNMVPAPEQGFQIEEYDLPMGDEINQQVKISI